LTEIKGTALRCAENRDGKAIWHWKKKNVPSTLRGSSFPLAARMFNVSLELTKLL
jgi:hypothetical protein